MGTGGLGGGVMFLIIALLWAVVLVPAWFRRREFNAAERNALRLQRTLRVLAETAEVPHEVRVEATAREALAHERLLKTAQKRQEAEREAELANARAEQVRAEIRAQQMQRKQVAMNRAAKLRKPIVRRVRSIAALAGLLGLVGSLVGLGMLIAGIGPAVLLWSLLAFTVGLGTLVLLAPGRAKLAPIAAEQEAVAKTVDEPVFEKVSATGETRDSAAAHAAAQRAAADRIERARTLARAREARAYAPRENQPDSILLREVREQVARQRRIEAGSEQPATGNQATPAAKDRAAATAPGVSTGGQAQSRSAANSRLSQLGVVGDTADGMPDLDQVLRRRRNAG
ncbi:hypothetical protein [Leucobacter aridicollis]|uniref:hypothetical protein n=1 Tax=Leucobacter aridicollis TaxID=283878 RepID=UPI002103E869|nr:hypothetical protein [Leucobacter aridicollis]UTX52623.1 hypothetical protein KI794_12935 [Leucobacter aridicollis]